MSFYGQVLYEFSKLFSQLKTENSTSEDVFAAGSNDPLAPTEQWDSLNIEGANKWIQVNSTQNNKTIKIGHGAPGAADATKTVVGFQPLAAVPEGKTAVELTAGTVIKTSSSEYDTAGHARGSTESYFILPANNTEKDLTQITERVKNLEDTYIAETEFNDLAGNYLSTNQYVQEDGFETKTQTYLDEKKYVHAQELEEGETYATTKITGTLNEMYPEGDTETIANTIGIMIGEDSFIPSLKQMLLLPDDYEINYNLSQAIKSLCETVKAQAQDLQRVQLAQAELLIHNNELRTRIDKLEKQLNPTE